MQIQMTKYLGVDLGTTNTRIYLKGKGIVLREPSVVALDGNGTKVLAVGDEAKMMLGKTPQSKKTYKPLKDGVIADFDVTAAMLHHFFRKISGAGFLSRPRVIISVPYGVTGVEKRAVEDATLDAGAKNVALIEEPIAAAIGSETDISRARGRMVVDIGGGTTEVAVMSLGGIVIADSIRTGGDEIDEAIVAYIKYKYNVLVDTVTAEVLKRTIGSLWQTSDVGAMDIRGRNQASGLPVTLKLTSAELREAMGEEISRILECIRAVLEKTPPELSADIFDSGIVLTGGCAKLRGFDVMLSKYTGMRVAVAKRPLDSVILGIGKVIDGMGQSESAINFRNK